MKGPGMEDDEMRIDAAEQRKTMVMSQIMRRGIRNPALTRALQRVPREKFVPAGLAEFAYEDSALPIQENQTISQPYIVALMVDALEIDPTDRVLEIGTGSGYAAAVLAELAAEVFTIERRQGLCDTARARLDRLGYRNVQMRCADGTKGWPAVAPFDAIAVAAGGPGVPTSLREQLAIGGRLVIPVGDEGAQRLLRMRRIADDIYEEDDLGAVQFVPLIGEEGWDASAATLPRERRARAPRPAARPRTLAAIVARAAEPFASSADADLRPLLERIGKARVVLLGEASHGTAEFYEMRARITRALIAEDSAVRIVAVEADWPDARQIDRFVRGETPDPHPERAFTRFPTWMWANRQVLSFAKALREWNQARLGEAQVGFFGLDLYSLYTSIRSVLAYLDDVDADAAAVARARYGCLAPWEHDPAAYGAAAVRGRFEGCGKEVVRMLQDLLRRRLEYEPRDPGRFFDAERNAALVRNAEGYYRAMYDGPHSSWNLRDRHMFDTLQALLNHAGAGVRAVVWAHNSHLGNAAATSMSARGETNIGELCRNAFGDDCYAIGFGTDHGTVAAADNWDEPMKVMDVRPAHESSYERVCHDTQLEGFLLSLRRNAVPDVRGVLMAERLERAIGVIYRPQTELVSHYFHAALPRQFDEWIWFDETRAVESFGVQPDPDKLPETFPFGL
jgi:protein-L-isoaspartate(D-aspartate) O-methyltransferase